MTNKQRSEMYIRQFHRNRITRFAKGKQVRGYEDDSDLARSKKIISDFEGK